jgi:glycosyltransferase involved in cell wall biosynthesis
MRIVQVLPGSGDNFYCENCVRDNLTVRALEAARQDVVAVPLYLPQILERVDAIARAPVFYGGINTYLQQTSAFFRNTPRWLDRIFDSRWLLRWAARRAGSVRANGLGELTLSVMKGAEGRQGKELTRLLRWLEAMERPDVVHLSTSLLVGIGLAIKKRLGIPVVCTLQDEDVWLDAMEEPSRTRCWESMAELGKGVDAYIAVSRYFARIMRERLKIDPERMHVVPIGVDPGQFAPPDLAPAVPALGYLARMSDGMGLGILVEAWLELKRIPALKSLRLHLCGGRTADDGTYLKKLEETFAREGVAGDVRFFDQFDPPSRREFLGSLSVLSVPTPSGVAFGTYILESLACGVPVVQPRVGSFPEVLEATGGGLLYDGVRNPHALARTLEDLLKDEGRRQELGRRGRESVARSFGLDTMASGMIEVYRRVLPGKPSGRTP